MWPYRQSTSIPAELLIHRRLYQIESRNLVVGVWNEDRQGFTGIRVKFGDRYLFTEIEWNVPGTAYALKDLTVGLPKTIDLEEGAPEDTSTGRRVKWIKDLHGSGHNGYVYEDDGSLTPKDAPILYVPNTALFEFLDSYDKYYSEVALKEYEDWKKNLLDIKGE